MMKQKKLLSICSCCCKTW